MKLPFRSHSLATKLTYRIMAVVFVMLAVITGILNILVRHSMGQEAEERYQGVLLKAMAKDSGDWTGPYMEYEGVIDTLGRQMLVTTYADFLHDRIVAQMIQGKTGSVRITVDGVRSWVYFHRVPHVECSIAIVVPEEVIYHHGRELNTLILLLMFFCLGTVYFVSRRQILLTTRPLHSFAQSADNYFLLPVKPNLPIGAISDWRYEEQQEQLQRGDMLFLHTAEQYDDITLMAIRLEASKGLELPAEMQQMDHITDYVVGVAHNCGMSQKGMKQLRLAIEEAAANIVSYSQATTIRLTTAVADGQLLVSISDDGQPFDPTVAATADLSIPADERPPGGLGIVFLRQMTDGLDYQRTGDRNILTIRKTIC